MSDTDPNEEEVPPIAEEMHQLEGRLTSERAKDAFAVKRAQGVKLGRRAKQQRRLIEVGKLPFGYQA